MPVETTTDRIVIDPQVLQGKPIIKGTRISVGFILDLMAQSWKVEDIPDTKGRKCVE